MTDNLDILYQEIVREPHKNLTNCWESVPRIESLIQKTLTWRITYDIDKELVFGMHVHCDMPFQFSPYRDLDVNCWHISRCNMKKDFYLDVYTILNRIQLTIWTICAFRVLNPRQWSLAKQSNSKFNSVSRILRICLFHFGYLSLKTTSISKLSHYRMEEHKDIVLIRYLQYMPMTETFMNCNAIKLFFWMQ